MAENRALDDIARECVASLYRGEPWDGAGRAIDGWVLRALAFGLIDREGKPPTDGKPHLPGTGIVIRNAVIKGVIDLNGAGADPHMGALTLDLDECRLEGNDERDDQGRAKASLVAANARFVRVRLAKCKFSRVDFSSAAISGACLIEGAGEVKEGEGCCLDLSFAEVGGVVRIRDSVFKLCASEKEDPDGKLRYALDLRGAQLGAHLFLEPRVDAYGGVTGNGCQIAGDVWAQGLKAVAEDGESAIDFSLAKISGSVIIRAQSEPKKGPRTPRIERGVHIEGCVNFLSAEVGAWLQFEFDTFKAGKRSELFLRLSLARIGGQLWIRGARKPGEGEPNPIANADFAGEIEIDGAEIGANLTIARLNMHTSQATAFTRGIGLSQSRIGHSLWLGDEGSRLRWVNADQIRVGADFFLRGEIGAEGLHWSCFLSNADVGGTVSIGGRILGGANLDFARIQRVLRIESDARLQPAPANPVALSAKQTSCGRVELMGAFCGKLDFQLARIDGSFEFGGLDASNQPRPLAFLFGDKIPDPEISLTDAEIRGVLHVRALRDLPFAPQDVFQKSTAARRIGSSVRDRASEPGDRKEPAQKDLKRPRLPVTGFQRLMPVQFRSIALLCYPGWTLVETKREAESDGYDFYMLGPNGERVPLDGTSPPIHQFNVERKQEKSNKRLLSLNTEAEVKAYLRFFCGCVWGDEGPFYILESKEALIGEIVVEGSMDAVRPIAVSRADDGNWQAEAAVLFAWHVFTARFKIFTTGMIEMLDDQPIAKLGDEDNVKYERPLRLHKSTSDGQWPRPLMEGAWTPNDEKVRKAERAAIDRERAVALGLSRSARGPTEQRRYRVDLSHAHAGLLRDADASAWPDWVGLNLVGFRYESIDTGNAGAEIAGPSPQKSAAKTAGSLEELLASPQRNWTEPDALVAQSLVEEERRGKIEGESRRFSAHLRTKAASGSAVLAAGRKGWLQRSFDPGDAGQAFQPQPFEQLIATFRRGGYYDDAREIVEYRAEIKSRRDGRSRRLIGRAGWALSLPAHLAWRWFFGHGLRPVNAFITTIALWAAGGVAATYLAWGDLWLPGAKESQPGIFGTTLETRRPALELSLTTVSDAFAMQAADIPADRDGPACRDEIRPGVYAADAMLPFLDFGEERRCELRKDAWLSKWLKAIYSGLGALVLSLTIVTITNAARRYLDR